MSHQSQKLSQSLTKSMISSAKSPIWSQNMAVSALRCGRSCTIWTRCSRTPTARSRGAICAVNSQKVRGRCGTMMTGDRSAIFGDAAGALSLDRDPAAVPCLRAPGRRAADGLRRALWLRHPRVLGAAAVHVRLPLGSVHGAAQAAEIRHALRRLYAGSQFNPPARSAAVHDGADDHRRRQG